MKMKLKSKRTRRSVAESRFEPEFSFNPILFRFPNCEIEESGGTELILLVYHSHRSDSTAVLHRLHRKNPVKNEIESPFDSMMMDLGEMEKSLIVNEGYGEDDECITVEFL